MSAGRNRATSGQGFARSLPKAKSSQLTPAPQPPSQSSKRKRPEVPQPVARPLKAYAFDPSVGKLLGNEMTLSVRYQKLDRGPTVLDRTADGIAIVDYDGANGWYYLPVDLDDARILICGGLEPSEANPRFHQQMVYAVVSETIEHFERALGRRIHWRRGLWDGRKHPEREKIGTLLLLPHAFIGQNAFYSPEAHGILFGYFRADRDATGNTLPGQTVYTCLSHDIIVHETTHAIVDGIRTYFTEQTNPDVPAFHEAFADLAALFRHFSHKQVLRDTIERTGGALYQYQLRPDAAISAADAYAGDKDGTPVGSFEVSGRNPLVELAKQFGEATGRQRALRSALGTKPNLNDIQKLMEPHARGSILVAAVFDAFFAIFIQRTSDLWRIYRAGGGSDHPTDIPTALADRLCDEATGLSEQFFLICVRALDYCPPVDITFGDYLRAIVTADVDLQPRGEGGIRGAIMQSFRLRGIVPDDADYFSERSIAWPSAESRQLPPIIGLRFGDGNGLTHKQADKVGKVLRRYLDNPSTRADLGFDPTLPVTLPSFHPAFRINYDGSLRMDLIAEVVQTREQTVNPNVPAFGTFPLRGGATLIIQRPTVDEIVATDDRTAKIRYVIGKHLHGPEGDLRLMRQRRYCERLGLEGDDGASRFRINFAMTHEGL